LETKRYVERILNIRVGIFYVDTVRPKSGVNT
jgi:hypothetical protein